MNTINFVNPSNNEILIEVSRFPDGQQNCKIIETPVKFHSEAVTIKTRLNDFSDLELLICTVKSLRNMGIEDIFLYVPYFLGSRSDRQFSEGGNNYLKDVICPIINSLDFKGVTVMDPHSDVLEVCINNFNKVDNITLMKFALFQTYASSKPNDNMVLVSPDAGATKKIFKLAEKIEYKGDIITCSKNRDEHGKLSETIIPWRDLYVKKDLILIDDICDGGATFINIAKSIKCEGSPFVGKLYLIITHGIFSKGLKELSEYFDSIYCTNSYRDINSMNEFGMHNERYLNRVKQLNVF